MWRSILAVFLAPVLTAAQAAQTEGVPAVPSYQAFTEQPTIRQGTTESVYLLLSLSNDAIVSPREPSHDVVSLKIDIDSADGITATSVAFPPQDMMRVTLQKREALHASLDSLVDSAAKAGSPGISRTAPALPSPDKFARISAEKPSIAVLNPQVGVRFKVKVSKNTTPGTHQLRGRITYQPIRADGVFPPEQMGIVIPITVVDRKARAPRNAASANLSGSNTGNYDWIWLILLAPILLPLSILAALVGMDC